jgi:sugar phosphate isomerase/epimerase
LELALSLGAAASLKRDSGRPDPALEALVLDWAAHAGFDGIDLVELWTPFFELTDAELAALRSAVESRGLRVLSINCFRKVLPGPDESLLAQVPRVAEALGASIVSVAPFPASGLKPDKAWAGTLRALTGLVEAGAGRMSLSIELHDGGAFTDSAETCLRLAAAVGAGVNPDIGNWVRSRSPVDAMAWKAEFLALAPQANLWHAKNFRLLSSGMALPATLSEGDIDYRFALAAMWRAGFVGPVVLEPSRIGDALETAAQGRRYLAELLTNWVPSLATPRN